LNVPQNIGGIAYLQDVTGWLVDTSGAFLAGQGVGTGERHLDEQFIFVDPRNETQYVVYLTTRKGSL
jgi:hypothetical protein